MKQLFTIVTLLATMLLSACTSSNSQSVGGAVDSKTFSKKIDEATDKIILDVRTPEEYATGHLKNSINLNIYDADFAQQLSKLEKSKTVFVYCKAGGRSAQAAEQLSASGFKNVYDLQGGVMAWNNENLPLVTTSAVVPTDKFTQQDFDRLVGENDFIMFDFYATWCIPCKKMNPTMEKLTVELKDKLVIKRVNVDDAPTLCKELKMESIPVIMLYKHGKLMSSVSGFQSEDDLRMLISNGK